jgi:hypothetical protein
MLSIYDMRREEGGSRTQKGHSLVSRHLTRIMHTYLGRYAAWFTRERWNMVVSQRGGLKWSTREAESLDKYIRYLWTDRGLIHELEDISACNVQAGRRNYCAPKD